MLFRCSENSQNVQGAQQQDLRMESSLLTEYIRLHHLRQILAKQLHEGEVNKKSSLPADGILQNAVEMSAPVPTQPQASKNMGGRRQNVQKWGSASLFFKFRLTSCLSQV
jgi:hypothetical protein